VPTTRATAEYFARKAENYDLVDHQVYWRLSDDLLWDYLSGEVLTETPVSGTFLDAGGGTGRWTDRIARAMPSLRGTVVDLSDEMLSVARGKARAHGYDGRVSYVVGDLGHLDEIVVDDPCAPFDLAICFHNVIGFVEDPRRTVELVVRTLQPGGLFVLMAPSRLHAAFFNLTLGRIDAAEAALDGRGRFTADMPEIWLFTPSQLADEFTAAGLTIVDQIGFPALVYPGFEETQEEGTSERAAKILDDPASYARIFDMERRAMKVPGQAARGNNLVIVGRKARRARR
jgi:SAM-dependent methyltransferase